MPAHPRLDAPSRWEFLQEAVRFLVDDSARAYGDDLDDSFGCNFVDDSETAYLEALEPSQFVPERFAHTGV